MKTQLSILIAIFITTYSLSQEVENVDYISPFHENMAAIRSGNSWGFVDVKGDFAVSLRSDLIIPSQSSVELPYPYFSEGRALIMEERENIVYYGYINKKGNTIIPTKYIRATPFNAYGKALALELFKQNLGENDILDKHMVRYVYNQVVLDTTGNAVYYLKEPHHILPTKDQLSHSLKITSYFVAPTLVAVENESGTWDIVDITKN